jgi:hypothetical protein
VSACDMCGDNLAGYFPGVMRCDNCADLYGLEYSSEPIATLTRGEIDRVFYKALTRGLRIGSDGFYIADPEV